jgi:hypothetical protein
MDWNNVTAEELVGALQEVCPNQVLCFWQSKCAQTWFLSRVVDVAGFRLQTPSKFEEVQHLEKGRCL